jgi:RNA polymerase sigma-70 factor (ECF subfamily)
MDLAEFEGRCEEHRRALMAYAFTCCRKLDLAEDIVQETFLIAFQKRDQYFAEADFGGWLISIARHVWFRERDRRRLHENATQFLHDHASLIFDRENYSDSQWDQQREALEGCLRKLGDIERDLIHAHFARRLTYAEIAGTMQRTLAWVKVRMFRARVALMECVRLALRGEVGGL